MKDFFCAECGERVRVIYKSLRSHGKVYRLVYPHKCEETTGIDLSVVERIEAAEEKPKINLEDSFKDFKFVKKLNDLEEERNTAMDVVHEENYGDRRDKDHLRKEIETPQGILDQVRQQQQGD